MVLVLNAKVKTLVLAIKGNVVVDLKLILVWVSIYFSAAMNWLVMYKQIFGQFNYSS